MTVYLLIRFNMQAVAAKSSDGLGTMMTRLLVRDKYRTVRTQTTIR